MERNFGAPVCLPVGSVTRPGVGDAHGSPGGPENGAWQPARLGREGFVLPLTILLLPAFLALSFSAFVLAQGQLVAARQDARLLEAMAVATPPEVPLPAQGEEVMALDSGYLLLRAPTTEMSGGRRGLRLAWHPEPGGTAGRWARTPEGPPDLGPLSLDDLLGHLRLREVEDAVHFPDEGGSLTLDTGHRVHAPGALLLLMPDGGIALVSPGRVELTGESPLSGIILAKGDIRLGGGVTLTGAARTHGAIHLQEGSGFFADSAAAHSVLARSLLATPLPVPGGMRLGRH